jgi:hypothetical protein
MNARHREHDADTGSAAARPPVWKRESTAIVAAVVLVLFRNLVYLLYEHANFDSDQAIIGLMATHLVEGRAFPLFLYGAGYMLSVGAWFAAPWIAIFGSSVAALHASVVLTNAVVAALLLHGLVRHAGLPPLLAMAAAIFFVLPPPDAAKYIDEAAGGNVEPFLFVVLLWYLRARPLWFGVVLAVGFLNREFTAYAVPALLVAQGCTGRLFTRAGARFWAVAAVGFFAVWEVVMALQPWIDFYGPGTRGELVAGRPLAPLANLAHRSAFSTRELLSNLESIWSENVALLFNYYASSPSQATGHAWLAWVIAAVAALIVVRLTVLCLRADALTTCPKVQRSMPDGDRSAAGEARGWFRVRVAWARPAAFPAFLGCVGLEALAVYALTRPALIGTIRYMLLTLLLPIGVCGAYFCLEPRRDLRRVVLAAIAVWALFAGVDNGRLLYAFVDRTPPNDMRVLADGLVARGIDVAESDYWTAYRLSYLTGERVKVASTTVIRITEYQRLAAAKGKQLMQISEDPCPAPAARLAIWYLCPASR